MIYFIFCRLIGRGADLMAIRAARLGSVAVLALALTGVAGAADLRAPVRSRAHVPVLDEVDDTSILKTGRFPRLPTISLLDAIMETCHRLYGCLCSISIGSSSFTDLISLI